MDKVYVDWAVSKPHTVLVNNEISQMSDKELLKLSGKKIFVEKGCPNKILRELKVKGNEIFQIDSKEVFGYRSKLNLEKSDVNDVMIIREIVQGSLNDFKKSNLKISILAELMRRYDKIVKISVMLQNQYKAYVREFGDTRGLEQIETFIEIFNGEKTKILSEARLIISDELGKVKHIKGLGIRYLSGILAYAHPRKFSSLSKFLAYCGYKNSVKISKKYNRTVKSFVSRVVILVVIKKDKRYYPLYKKIKSNLKKRHPTYTKGKVDGMSKNRVATFLLKEIYQLFHGGGNI